MNFLSHLLKVRDIEGKQNKADYIDSACKEVDYYKDLFTIIFDKDIRFFVAVKNLQYEGKSLLALDDAEIDDGLYNLLKDLSQGLFRGNEALKLCNTFMESLYNDEAFMFMDILENKLRLGIGRTDLNKRSETVSVDVFEYMAAIQYNKAKWKKDKQYVIQPKIDGMRCIGICNKGKILFYSRGGKKINSINFIENQINERISYQDSFVLDGEIENGTLEETGSIRRKTDQIETATYTVFGLYSLEEWNSKKHSTSYDKVFGYAQELTDTLSNVRLIPSYPIGKPTDPNFFELIEKYNLEFLNLGYEGSVVKTIDHVYQPSTGSKRSQDWIKVKPWHDSEARIYGFELEDGMHGQILGKFLVNWNGIKFPLAPGNFTHGQRKYIWENQGEYINKLVTFKFQTLTEKNAVPRHASAIRIRED